MFVRGPDERPDGIPAALRAWNGGTDEFSENATLLVAGVRPSNRAPATAETSGGRAQFKAGSATREPLGTPACAQGVVTFRQRPTRAARSPT